MIGGVLAKVVPGSGDVLDKVVSVTEMLAPPQELVITPDRVTRDSMIF